MARRRRNALLGGFALALSVAMLVAPDEDTWSARACLLGIFVGAGWIASGSFGFHRMFLRKARLDGRRVTVETVYGRPAVVLRWRRTVLLWPMLSMAFFAAVLGWVAVGLFRDRPGGGAWFVAVLAALFAVYLPDSFIRATRHCRLVLTPEGIGADRWDGDAWLDWDDIATAEFRDVGSYWILRVEGVAGARSWRWRRRRRVLYVPQPRAPRIEVPGPALDVDSVWLANLVVHYARTPLARSELATDLGRLRLAERLNPGV